MNRRNTIQRDLVLDAVRTLMCHATADEIYECIIKQYPSVGKGTVYRNLNILSDNGDIRKIRIADGPDRFDHNCTDHYHVTCTHCGRVWDVDMDILPDLCGKIRDKKGIEYTGFEVMFSGICPGCQEGEKRV